MANKRMTVELLFSGNFKDVRQGLTQMKADFTDWKQSSQRTMREINAQTTRWSNNLRGAGTALSVFTGAVAVGMATAGKKITDTTRLFEDLNLQIEILVGKGETPSLIKWIEEFTASTPYALAQIGEYTKLFLAMGASIDEITRKDKGLAQTLLQASAVMGRDPDQVIRAYFKLKAGSYDMPEMAPIGVTREFLSRYGVEFTKQGSLASTGEEAADAMLTGLEARFGGLFARLGEQLGTMIVNLGDKGTQLINRVGQPVHEFAKELMRDLNSILGQALEDDNLIDSITEAVQQLVNAAQPLKELVIDKLELLADTLERDPSALVDGLQKLVNILKWIASAAGALLSTTAILNLVRGITALAAALGAPTAGVSIGVGATLIALLLLFKKGLDDLIPTAQTTTTKTDRLTQALEDSRQSLLDTIEATGDLAEQAESAQEPVEQLGTTAQETGDQVSQALGSDVPDALDKAAQAGQTTADAWAQAMGSMENSVNKVLEVVRELEAEMTQSISDTRNNLVVSQGFFGPVFPDDIGDPNDRLNSLGRWAYNLQTGGGVMTTQGVRLNSKADLVFRTRNGEVYDYKGFTIDPSARGISEQNRTIGWDYAYADAWATWAMGQNQTYNQQQLNTRSLDALRQEYENEYQRRNPGKGIPFLGPKSYGLSPEGERMFYEWYLEQPAPAASSSPAATTTDTSADEALAKEMEKFQQELDKQVLGIVSDAAYQGPTENGCVRAAVHRLRALGIPVPDMNSTAELQAWLRDEGSQWLMQVPLEEAAGFAVMLSQDRTDTTTGGGPNGIPDHAMTKVGPVKGNLVPALDQANKVKNYGTGYIDETWVLKPGVAEQLLGRYLPGPESTVDPLVARSLEFATTVQTTIDEFDRVRAGAESLGVTLPDLNDRGVRLRDTLATLYEQALSEGLDLSLLSPVQQEVLTAAFVSRLEEQDRKADALETKQREAAQARLDAARKELAIAEARRAGDDQYAAALEGEQLLADLEKPLAELRDTSDLTADQVDALKLAAVSAAIALGSFAASMKTLAPGLAAALEARLATYQNELDIALGLRTPGESLLEDGPYSGGAPGAWISEEEARIRGFDNALDVRNLDGSCSGGG